MRDGSSPHRPPASLTALGVHLSTLLRFRGIWILPAAVALLYLLGFMIRISAWSMGLLPRPPFGERIPLTTFEYLLSPGSPPTPIFVEAIPILGLLGAVWGVLIWQDEGRDVRDYMWSLPVDRPRHELLRVLAGAICLWGAIAICLALGAILARASDQPLLPPHGWVAWVSAFAIPTVTFLALSIPAIAARYPLGVIAFGALCYAGMFLISIPRSVERLAETAFNVFIGGQDGWGLLGTLAEGYSRGSAAWSALGPNRARYLEVLAAWRPDGWLLSTLVWTSLLVGGASLAARRRG